MIIPNCFDDQPCIDLDVFVANDEEFIPPVISIMGSISTEITDSKNTCNCQRRWMQLVIFDRNFVKLLIF